MENIFQLSLFLHDVTHDTGQFGLNTWSKKKQINPD